MCSDFFTADGGVLCAEHHFTCAGCFYGSMAQACGQGGMFVSKKLSAAPGEAPSEAGEFPCLLFVSGECADGCLPMKEVLRVAITDEAAMTTLLAAKNRIGVDAALAAHKAEAEAEERQNTGALSALRLRVQQALTAGQHVPCPGCHAGGVKDEECMHIECPECHINWCYCCGQGLQLCPRGGGGCDEVSAYLHNNPGWKRFAVHGETAKQGASQEFIRRRMAHKLRLEKEHAEPELWAALRAEHPDLLRDVPTVGRSIDWDTLDSAGLPQFGARTEAAVARRRQEAEQRRESEDRARRRRQEDEERARRQRREAEELARRQQQEEETRARRLRQEDEERASRQRSVFLAGYTDGDLRKAAMAGDRGKVAALLGAGLDVNDAAEVLESGHTPLICAAQNGHPEVCSALAAAGANLEAALTSGGGTALILAAQNVVNKGYEAGKLATVEALLAAGANVHAARNDGFTALLVCGLAAAAAIEVHRRLLAR